MINKGNILYIIMETPEKCGTPTQGNTKEVLILRRDSCIREYLMVPIGTREESKLYGEIMGLTDAITIVGGEQ